MELIASGRASEIFDIGGGLVLRRFRAGGDSERESLVMEHALTHGFPVPRVLEVHPDALVLERIDGPVMWSELRRRPWLLGAHARALAELHDRLHEIPAPATLPAAGAGDRLLHLDLHPANVLLSPVGPVVVDWTNARRGEPALDLAMTWVICATSAGVLGRPFAQRFLSHVDRAEAAQALPAAGERRLADVNVTDRERARVRRLLEQAR